MQLRVRDLRFLAPSLWSFRSRVATAAARRPSPRGARRLSLPPRPAPTNRSGQPALDRLPKSGSSPAPYQPRGRRSTREHLNPAMTGRDRFTTGMAAGTRQGWLSHCSWVASVGYLARPGESSRRLLSDRNWKPGGAGQ